MKKVLSILGLLAILFFVSACGESAFGNDGNGSDDVRQTVATKWYSTERGDVLCTDSPLPYSMEQHDCDWQTLGTRPSSEEVDSGLSSQWIKTDKGEVWCLVSPVSHQGHTTECDWETLGKRVNSGRLPTFEDSSKK